ncbi:unnamed protein product [Citrullus colocynthis]|uniref:Transmembrane protein n=1 Tax=Citrullus colocynthis TaxID=252529 RepID=A0ABP0Z891_9ROSI
MGRRRRQASPNWLSEVHGGRVSTFSRSLCSDFVLQQFSSESVHRSPMASSSILFSTFCSVFVLLLGAFISPGLKSGNMAMAIEDEDSMALLPFGSVSGVGLVTHIPHHFLVFELVASQGHSPFYWFSISVQFLPNFLKIK